MNLVQNINNIVKQSLKKIKFMRGNTASRPNLEDGEIYIDKEKKTIVVGIENNEAFELISTSVYNDTNLTATNALNAANAASSNSTAALNTANTALNSVIALGTPSNNSNPYGKSLQHRSYKNGNSSVTYLSNINIYDPSCVVRYNNSIIFIKDTGSNLLYKVDLYSKQILATVNIPIINSFPIMYLVTDNNVDYIYMFAYTYATSTNYLFKVNCSNCQLTITNPTTLIGYTGSIFSAYTNTIYSFDGSSIITSCDVTGTDGIVNIAITPSMTYGSIVSMSDSYRFVIFEQYMSGSNSRIRYRIFNSITKTLSSLIDITTLLPSTAHAIANIKSIYAFRLNTIFSESINVNTNDTIVFAINISTNTVIYTSLKTIVSTELGYNISTWSDIMVDVIDYNQSLDVLEVFATVNSIGLCLFRFNSSTLALIAIHKLNKTFNNGDNTIRLRALANYDDFLIAKTSNNKLAIVEF